MAAEPAIAGRGLPPAGLAVLVGVQHYGRRLARGQRELDGDGALDDIPALLVVVRPPAETTLRVTAPVAVLRCARTSGPAPPATLAPAL
ncbi:hypothetical protein OHA32_11805 [Streptomyces erythrochromogenes]|nr:hypothetical protein [Streptomyces erythrochromogenes]MCX5584027.1 hypothetical protein [Streptomyces erythrochromogenes]